jgi:hypothetical protein
MVSQGVEGAITKQAVEVVLVADRMAGKILAFSMLEKGIVLVFPVLTVFFFHRSLRLLFVKPYPTA